MPKRKKPSQDSMQEQPDPMPSLPSPSAVAPYASPALTRFIEAVRKAVLAALDLADAAAAKMTRP